MNKDWLLLIPVLLPALAGLATVFVKPFSSGKGRNGFVMAVLLATLASLIPVLTGGDKQLLILKLGEDLPVLLRKDTAACFFAAVMAFIWCAAGLYSFEYMEHEENQARFYGFYLITLGMLMALCFSGSIITFYMFYEMMTLLTVPLVMHTMEKEAVAAGIKYLIYSVTGASLVLLGTFLLSPYAQTFTFTAGGVLKARAPQGLVLASAFLMILGFGTKAGMFPLHGWLPTAHPVAPAPASAVLSGIITKAGVLGEIRLIYYFIGADTLRGTWVQTAFMSLTLFTVFMGSLLAFREKLFKKRLAYSSVSQVSYILFGISTLNPLGFAGSLLHVVAHALIKNTLFMSAGAVIHKTGKTGTDELGGIGKQMPVTMWCFTVASVGLVGIPPCLGFVSKWYLAQGALDMTGVAPFFRYAAPAVLLISALLTAGYLLTITIRGFFPGANAGVFEKKEPTWKMLVPLCCLAGLMVLLGMFSGKLIALFTSFAESIL